MKRTKPTGLPNFVIFDLDNTLYEYEKCHEEATSRLITFLAELLSTDAFKISEDLSRARIAVKARLGTTAASHSRIAYINELLNASQSAMSLTNLALAERIYWENFYRKMKLRPGAIEFISDLKELKIPMYLITDLTLAIQIEKLEKLGLQNVFKKVISSEEAGGDKITDLPFQLLKRYLGGVTDTFWSLGDQCWDFPQNFGSKHLEFALDEINCEHNHPVMSFKSIRETLVNSNSIN
jgi:putative hydrolase of the HAD superfamily